ncbi:hypothetical protein ABXZ88_003956 [Vibrio fluvialis]|jgi:hypothetical protein
MVKTSVAATPKYKPLVYCELAKRPDLMLFTLLQREVTFEEGNAVFSPLMSSCFGLLVEGSTIHVGVPTELWKLFKLITWDGYCVEGENLMLFYKVKLKTRTVRSSFIKSQESESIIGYTLKCSFPLKSLVVPSVRKAWKLILCPLNSEADSITSGISLTNIATE